MTKVLIDGDIIVYSSAFAAEGRHYMVRDHKIKYKKEAVEYCKKEGIPESEILFFTTPEPLENALHNAKSLLLTILDDTLAEEHDIYLTGEDNFRESAAVTQPYKGNRTLPKPYHYQNVVDYLIENWKATVVDGMEADDAMGLQQDTEYSIIATIDKDLDQIPGWHYNWRERILYQVLPIEGMRNFFKQMLTGDRTDNILGLAGIGDKTADRMLKDLMSEKEMYQIVSEAYQRQYGDDWKERFDENAALLWIKRKGREEYEYEDGGETDEGEQEIQEYSGKESCPSTRIELEL